MGLAIVDAGIRSRGNQFGRASAGQKYRRPYVLCQSKQWPLLLGRSFATRPKEAYKVHCSVEKDGVETSSKLPPFQSDVEQMSQSSPPPGAHSPGEVLNGRYEVTGILGQGGNAITYEAEDNTSNSKVAIKCLSLRGMKDWKQLDLFQRESRILEQLDHPGIPKYIGCFEQDFADDKRFYIVQEIASGKTLAELIQNGWRPSEDEVRRIGIELLNILQYLSTSRPPVVHRDVKPENIVLGGGKSGGRVYLVDFGGVQGVAQETFVVASTIVGTYGYMAPEQFRGEARPASDLYSFGATLLFLLSGRSPNSFAQNRLKIDFQDSVTMGDVMEEVIDGLLEPLPEDRLTASEALSILGGLGKQNQKGVMGGKRSWRPVGSRVILDKGRSKLTVEIPPSGLKGGSITTASFAVAWNAFVLFWTVGALSAGGGLLPLLFSLPFWAAGAELAKTSIGSSLIRQTLQIDRKNFTVKKQLALFRKGKPVLDEEEANSKEATGKSKDLVEAGLTDLMMINDEPYRAIEIREGVNKYTFGEGLDPVELEWLLKEINNTIDEVKRQRK